ncbi:MAG: hypothetical protein MJZ35_05380 [Bacteroidaceae bacterium]|nr:hypothetical protein [Bacteroidaceae bacterium]
MKTVATVEMKNMNVFNHATRRNHNVLDRLAQNLASLFSFILGEKVGTAYSLSMLNAMTSGTCAFLFGGASALIQVLLIVWFAVAVWQVKICAKK